MAVFGDDYGTPFGSVSPSEFFNSEGQGQYLYSGFSSRNGRTSIPQDDRVVITSTAVAPGKEGQAFYYAITASALGEMDIVVDDMPAWMTVTGNILGGTPDAAGDTTISITVTIGAFDDTKDVVVTIAGSATPVITSPSVANAIVNYPFVFPIFATGLPRSYLASGLPAGLSLDGGTIVGRPTTAGSVFVTVEVWDEFGGSDSNVIMLNTAAAPTNVIDVFAGTPGSSGYTGDAGPATSATLDTPCGIFPIGLDSYIVDQDNDVIRLVTAGFISTIVGGGGSGTANGVTALSATLNTPSRVVVDSSDNIFISDTGNNIVRRVDGITGLIATIAGDGTPGFAGDGGIGTSAKLDAPVGLALSPDEDSLYIVDRDNNRVRKLNLLTNIITTIAGTGSTTFNGDSISAVTAALGTPEDIVSDTNGDLYVTEFANHRVRKISNGLITTVAGTGVSGHTGDGALATLATITQPNGVVVDFLGNVYFSEGSHYVRKIEAVTGIILTITGTGIAGVGGNGAAASSASVSDPRGLATDSSGAIYLADSGNHEIRKIDPLPFPLIFSVTPTTSPEIGGPLITITGANFDASTVVSFGGRTWQAAATNFVNSTEVTATLPALPSFSLGSPAEVAVQDINGYGATMLNAVILDDPTDFSSYSGNFGGFSEFCNTGGLTFLPWKPIIIFPINYAVLKGIVEIDWQAPTPVDPCGGEATFELQFTRTLSKDSGWRTIASNIPEGDRTFLFDVTNIPYTADGGLRIRSKNSRNLYSDYSQSFQPFTIANHPPNAVTLMAPVPGDILDNTIAVTWKEPVVKDIDGHTVTYRIEATDSASSNTGWILIPGAEGIPDGTTSFMLDSEHFPEGDDYGIRVVATDELGADSLPGSSIGFSIQHSGEFMIDTLPPVGTLLINDGATLARSQKVKLSLFASDQGTGVKDVRFKNADEDCWGDFDSFVLEKTWNLSPTDGVKRVFVQYRDFADNVSESCDCEIISRVLCGAGNIVDLEVFNGKLYAAFDRNGNLLEYRVLVSQTASFAEPELSALAKFNNSLYIASYDSEEDVANVYRLDGTPVLVLPLTGTKVLSMVSYDDLLYLGLEDGRILAFTGTSSSTSYAAGSAITRLRTDGSVLYATVRGGGQYLSFDGVAWKVNSL